MDTSYDIMIVGGGMVGATLACALGNSPLRVAIIESRRPEPFEPEQIHDLRVSALSAASRHILEAVGAWEHMTRMRLCPYRRMRVWENKGDTEFVSDDIQETQLGHIVENRITQLALLQRIEDFDNIDLLCPAQPTRIDYRPGRSSVQFENGDTLSARLLIAADGGLSRVRDSAGIGVHHLDYKQHALVLSVATDYAQQDITWQRFLPSGPQAFLPLSGRCASLVWYHNPDEIRRLKTLPDDSLLAELLQVFPACLGNISHIYAKGSFPLRRQHALDYVKPGVALIGDAAHMIHPLAGQGVNIGLLDAAVLAEVLVDARQNHRDFASFPVLKQYEQRRRQDNWVMMTTMDLFYRVFSNDSPPLKLLRNLGLGAAERLKPAKNKVTRYAMGLEGTLPKLARGDALLPD